MLIKEISEIAEEVGLDNVDLMDISEILESRSQSLPSEEIYDLAQQFIEQW
jgi:cell division GTPase FtsZ